MKHNPKYILKHQSIRVPWHDNDWNGSVCSNPKANGACLILKNCVLSRTNKHQLVNVDNLTEKPYIVRESTTAIDIQFKS